MAAQLDSHYDHQPKPFRGVHFVLFGFGFINQQQVISKLVNGGGVDVAEYTQDCTHVIVDNLVYDNPLCVTARKDGKILVTGLWVDHSFDIGMPVDHTFIMYRPLKDLNGIPGANNLIMCLTGYQRQDRDDVMTMVSLMGAQFSKPLVANKVTHLICYKYEGEKYEVANKVKKIKLVNHKWLEDCLNSWQLLPEADYNKSGYELEMEAEVKDSDEEEDNSMQFRGTQMNTSFYGIQYRSPRTHRVQTPVGEVSKIPVETSVSASPSSVFIQKDIPSITGPFTSSSRTPTLKKCNEKSIEAVNCQKIQNNLFAYQSDPHDKTPVSTNVRNDLTSVPASAQKSPHSGVRKLSGMSTLSKNPQRTPIQTEILSNSSGTPKIQSGEPKISGGVEVSISNPKQVMNRNDFGCFNTPLKESELLHEEECTGLSQKRKMDSSCAGSKLQKTSDGLLSCNLSSLPIDNECQRPGTTPMTHGLSDINKHSPMGTTRTKSPSYNSSPLTGIQPVSETKTSKIWDNSNAEKATQSPLETLEESAFACEPATIDYTTLEGEKNVSHLKPVEKMLGKKSLGSRGRLGMSRTSNTANRKGSIYLDKNASQKNDAVCSGSGKGTVNEDPSNANKVEVPSCLNNNETLTKMNTRKALNTGNDKKNKNELMDDETEAPDDKVDEVEKAVDKGDEVAEVPKKQNIVIDEPSEVAQLTTTSGTENPLVLEVEHTVEHTNIELDKSICITDDMRGKSSEGKKRPERTKSNTVHAETKISKRNVRKDNAETKNTCDQLTTETETSLNKLENTKEAEKEIKPMIIGEKSKGRNKLCVDKMAAKSVIKKVAEKPNRGSLKTNQINDKVEPDILQVGVVQRKVKAEPTCFLVSGHRLQRKEFQKIIKHLKGKSCRDSHQWSYQATHLIVPDPIRRTEKFFAAAASGRWILNSDYLTASNQAGKLLAEEPYEWHKKGLSEDGTINMEAPRKWRLLREKTRHGAFYGMRIIIYGECISPTLDTLKRAVKTGDGTILATSPPYTRFLDTGIDFAIVSPTMPRVDMWVQEFLKHEVPCVLADYLVEYVCKPGYSLEKHVLFNTHAWAEKSFSALQNKSEEILVDSTTHDRGDDDDLMCQICGSADRGEVMLICGDESGSLGCGIGTHIDCCDPALDQVPEEDWFCSNCNGSRNSLFEKPQKKTSKRKR